MTTDRQQSEIRPIVTTDKLHAGKDARIASVVDLETILEFDNVTTRLATGVNRLYLCSAIGIHNYGTMLSPHHGYGDARPQWRDRPAFVEPDQLFVGQPPDSSKSAIYIGV